MTTKILILCLLDKYKNAGAWGKWGIWGFKKLKEQEQMEKERKW